MATADQVKALIKSHAAGDDERFYAVALQLAAREAQSGHAIYARGLEGTRRRRQGARAYDLADAGGSSAR